MGHQCSVKSWIPVIAACAAVAVAVAGCGSGAAARTATPKARPAKAAPPHCTPAANPFGQAPAGWEYREADAAQRAAVSRSLGDLPAHLEVALALRGGEMQGLLMAAAADDIAGVDSMIEDSARRQGAKVHHDRGVTVVDATDGGRTRYRTQGCTLVMVLGEEPATVDRIGEAVFTG